MQGRERVRTLYRSKDPTPHNQPMEGRKKKTVGDNKERAHHANRKALALHLKPACPTPSNHRVVSYIKFIFTEKFCTQLFDMKFHGGGNE